MKKHSKPEKEEVVVEIVADEPPPPPPPAPPPPAPPPPTRNFGEPKYLGDCTVDYKAETDVAKIAWASEEGIRRVELPGWVFEKLRGVLFSG